MTRRLRREPTPHGGEPWAPRYLFGAHLAVLYEMRGKGDDHRTAPYLNAQDAWTGSPQCECEACRRDRS